jgi:hypothetical protein
MIEFPRFASVLGCMAWLCATPAWAQDIVKLDPALDSLVASDAKVEIVKNGFGFTEGPVWVQKGKTGYLLFSDIPANVIYKLTADGNASVYLDHSGYIKPDIWRVGFEFNNGKDPSDPAFAKFYMNGSKRPRARPAGPVGDRDLRWTLDRPHRAEWKTYSAGGRLRRQTFQRH